MFVTLDLQAFHLESLLNEKSCLNTFLGFVRVLHYHIM